MYANVDEVDAGECRLHVLDKGFYPLGDAVGLQAEADVIAAAVEEDYLGAELDY